MRRIKPLHRANAAMQHTPAALNAYMPPLAAHLHAYTGQICSIATLICSTKAHLRHMQCIKAALQRIKQAHTAPTQRSTRALAPLLRRLKRYTSKNG